LLLFLRNRDANPHQDIPQSERSMGSGSKSFRISDGGINRLLQIGVRVELDSGSDQRALKEPETPRMVVIRSIVKIGSTIEHVPYYDRKPLFRCLVRLPGG
jgi:hypothetical protein